jgi:hypothetical protein
LLLADEASQPDIGALQQEAGEVHSFMVSQASRFSANENKLAELRDGLECTSRKVKEIGSAMNSLISLDVGGMKFSVSRKTLLQCGDSDSFFAKLLTALDGGVVSVDCDPATGCILIDRDPLTFKHVLNYLRGYRKFHVLPDDEADLLRADAEFYCLPGLMALLDQGRAPVEDQETLFPVGPGVSLDRKKFRAAYCVGTVGDRFLMLGRHSISFLVLNAEYVGIGVISESCACFDQEFHKVPNSCIYYMTGIFYSNFGVHRKDENLEKYDAGDRITVVMDLTTRIIEFHVKGLVKLVSCGTAPLRFKFAVAMKNNSRVRIIRPDEHQSA